MFARLFIIAALFAWAPSLASAGVLTSYELCAAAPSEAAMSIVLAELICIDGGPLSADTADVAASSGTTAAMTITVSSSVSPACLPGDCHPLDLPRVQWRLVITSSLLPPSPTLDGLLKPG